MVAKSNEINLIRVYDAPLETVWNAWNDPEQAAKWWGPRGFTLTTHSKELRPGGHWNYTMHGPDGTDYENVTYYHEVELHKKLVYDHGATKDTPPLFRVTVLFSESDGQTTMDMTMSLPTAEEATAIRKFIKEAGGNSTWDRLAEYLEETIHHQRSFVINRSFNASRETLTRMWTDPHHLVKWLPPQGMEMAIINGNIAVGQSIVFKMFDTSGNEFYGKLEYRQLDPSGRIVYAQKFCDADGQEGLNPFLSSFPPALLNTVLFVSEGDSTTRVTLTTRPLGETTEDQLKTFVDFRSSMTQGWTGSFDKLEDLV